MELVAIYYLVRDESREVMDKLNYYTREFCKQQKMPYKILTIILYDAEAYREQADYYANNNHQVYRAKRLRGGSKFMLLGPANKYNPMSFTT